MKRLINGLSSIALVLSIASTNASSTNNWHAIDKLTPEDLVARHLESLGAPEALDPSRSRVITGTARVTIRTGGHGQLDGTARISSQGVKTLISMDFGALDYPHEKFGFDGNKITVSQVKPGVRTIIGRYLHTNDVLFREGLLGGALSTAWPLLDLKKRNTKLDYAGLKKINNRPVHQLKCRPRDTNIGIQLYFDPETYQHVGSQYQQTIAAPVGLNRPADSVGQDETRVTIRESFSNFAVEGGLNLPHSYQIKLEIIAPQGSLNYEWTIELSKFVFGEPIPADEFNVDLTGTGQR